MPTDKQEQMEIIYRALQEGWSVKKIDKHRATFEFTRGSLVREIKDCKDRHVYGKSCSVPLVQSHGYKI